MDVDKILKQAQDWILGRLQEREGVFLPMIGTFAPAVEPEYLWQKQSGAETTTYLMPPRVKLSFMADDYLLDGAHYAAYGADVTEVVVPADLVSGVSGLLELAEAEVESAIRHHVEEVLRNTFKGRRQQLFDLCDFFVTEERDGLLLLNVEPLDSLCEQLNYPFSTYKPVEVRQGVAFPELDETREEYTKPIQQIPIHPVAEVQPEEAATEVEVPIVTEISTPEISTSEIPITESIEPDQIAEEPVSDGTDEQPKRKRTLLYIVFSLLGVAVVAIVWIFVARGHREGADVVVSTPVAPVAPVVTATDSTAVSDSVNVAETEPEVSEPVSTAPLDTLEIESGMTLAKLARTFYHNSKFWVYIYMNNRAVIKDPNNVPIGTRLEIPALGKYDILPDSLAARHEAMQWESIIQSGRFRSYEEQRSQLKPLEK